MARSGVAPGAWLVLASLLAAAAAEALIAGDLVVADGSGALVWIDADTGAQSLLPVRPIGTGERTPGVGLVRSGGIAARVVAPVPDVPISEVHVGPEGALDEPTLIWTVPDVLEDVEGSSRPDLWYAVGDHLWELHALTTLTGLVPVARRLTDVAGPYQRGTSLQIYEVDDGGGGKTVTRILVAAGSDGVLLWNAETGVLAPFGGTPASPTPPSDVVRGVADADDSLLAFGTTQIDLSGSTCTVASGLYLFALFGFASAANGALLRCAFGLSFAASDLGYATAFDDLLAGGNPRVVRLSADAGVWSASPLASGPPLSSPLDVEVVPEPLLTTPRPVCTRFFAVDATADAPDATPGDGACAAASGACTLRAAVMESNAVVSRDCIVLPAGVFELSLEGSDDDAELGDLDLLDDIVIGGAGRDATTIDGDAIAASVFEVVESGAYSVVLHDLGIRNGFGAEGSAIHFLAAGVLALDRVALRDNRADLGVGGAISLDFDAAATIRRSVVTGGRALSASAILAGGSLVVEDSTFSGNVPDGGASVIETFAPAAFVRTTFHDNEMGGSGCVVEALNDGVALRNVTFSGNREGDAVCTSFEGRAALWNVTIANHREAPIFGLSASPESIAMIHTAIGAPMDGGDACAAALDSRGGNVDPDGTCIGDGPGDQPARDVRLGALSDNGGATLTHRPRDGSPLLDAGRASACPAADQRGAPRPRDGDGDLEPRCDVGAVELAPEPGGLALTVLAVLCALRVARAGHVRGTRASLRR